MRRMRTGLLLALAVAVLAASPLSAQVAPSLTGETGLFEIYDAQTVPQGRFAFSLFYSMYDRTAAPVPYAGTLADDPLRYSTDKLGLTLAFGLLPNWEASFSTGNRSYDADDRAWAGVIGGRNQYGGIDHDETDKMRIGTKYILNQKDPLKIALFGAVYIPTQSRNDEYALSTWRSDWEWGFSGTYGIFTGQFAYLWTADATTDYESYDVSNEMRWSAGVGLPIIQDKLKGIVEVHRTMYDGGTTEPPAFTDAVLGARLALGKYFVASAGVRANVDRWVKYGDSPSNVGGILQVSFAPQPEKAEAPKAVPSPHQPPPPEPVPAPAPVVEPAPAPVVEAPPAPRPETSTTDEILFDAAKSRLTNIAKAILDGVALRLKNNLSATCTIVGFTDPKEKGDHAALGKARADAAKDYLVKRHGIDAARIQVDAKGDAEAGDDATRNRRAVVTVTFP